MVKFILKNQINKLMVWNILTTIPLNNVLVKSLYGKKNIFKIVFKYLIIAG